MHADRIQPNPTNIAFTNSELNSPWHLGLRVLNSGIEFPPAPGFPFVISLVCYVPVVPVLSPQATSPSTDLKRGSVALRLGIIKLRSL